MLILLRKGNEMTDVEKATGLIRGVIDATVKKDGALAVSLVETAYQCTERQALDFIMTLLEIERITLMNVFLVG